MESDVSRAGEIREGSISRVDERSISNMRGWKIIEVKCKALTLLTLLFELRHMHIFATVPFMKAAAAVSDGNRFNICNRNMI